MFEAEVNNAGHVETGKLFEDNEGWLVTSNENDAWKVAKINEDSDISDENREWVHFEPKDDHNEEPPRGINADKVKATPKLFIANLLSAESEGAHLRYESIRFKKVVICGTVIATYPQNERHALIVDDGTSNITCFFVKPESFLELKNEIKQDKEQLEKLLLEDSDRLLKVTYLMAKNSILKMQQVPVTWDDFSLGDVVTIFGKVKQYLNNRFIFVSKMIRHQDGPEALLKHMKELFYLHKNVY